MEIRRLRWSPITKVIIAILLLIFIIYLLFRFSLIWTPIILAIILAYVLSPAVNRIETRFAIGRGFATFLAYLSALVILILLPVVIVPPLAEQITEINLDFRRLMNQLQSWMGHPLFIAGQTVDLEDLFQQAVGSFQVAAEPFIGGTLELLMEVVSSLVWIIFIVIVSFYLVKDGTKLRVWIENLAPPAYRDDFVRIRDEISQVWALFFRGQLILALVVSILFSAVGVILGLPFALALGILAGLLEFLPSVGHGIWLVLASLVALFMGSTWLPLPNLVFMLIVIGLHLVYQQFDLNYLIPRIIGRSVHLPPLVVILGIVAGAVLAGVLGILLAAPTIASARIVGRYIYANLFDLDPFPTSVSAPLPPPNPDWWRKFSPR